MGEAAVVGQTDGLTVPRFAGLTTFARLPRLEDVSRYDVAILGVPFDAGTTYRPGARFGPSHVRESSRLLRPYHPYLDAVPFDQQQVVDAGDINCNPFSIAEAITQIQSGATALLSGGGRLITIGGDHTVALPLLRAVHPKTGPVAVVHFDAHLDTWDTYFGAPYTHGTPFRRASEEGLFRTDRSIHIGIRGSIYNRTDLPQDESLGFVTVHAMELERIGVSGAVERIRERVVDTPLYISIDIDVLDPAFAPGTGTPESGGLSSRELLGILRGLAGLPIASADVVEVAPAYDHAQVTGIAASHVIYELLALMATTPQ